MCIASLLNALCFGIPVGSTSGVVAMCVTPDTMLVSWLSDCRGVCVVMGLGLGKTREDSLGVHAVFQRLKVDQGHSCLGGEALLQD